MTTECGREGQGLGCPVLGGEGVRKVFLEMNLKVSFHIRMCIREHACTLHLGTAVRSMLGMSSEGREWFLSQDSWPG